MLLADIQEQSARLPVHVFLISILDIRFTIGYNYGIKKEMR